MKKINIKSFLQTIIFSLILNYCNAQSDIASPGGGHAGAGFTTYYCGWDIATTFPLNIRHDGNHAIQFFTDNVQRMIIDAQGNGSASGYVGIGNNFGMPKSRLHIHQGSSQDNWLQMTTTSTGSSTNALGLRIGIINTSKNVEIKQQEIADMLFHTSNTERMRILSGGNVGIGTASPGARLHVVTANSAGGAGFDGTKIDLTNTSASQSTVNNGVHVTSTITNTLTNDGVLSEVNGGNTCIGYKAIVNNSNTVASSNYGFSATLTDNGTSAATNNTGFLVGNLVSANATLNRGYVCSQGGGGTYSSGTMYGMVINDQDAENNTGILVTCSKGSTSTATGTLYGIQTTCGVTNGATVTNSIGGSFTAAGGTNITYGVYATGGNSCTASSCLQAAGYFSGLIYSTGALVVSDGALKNNVTAVTNGLSVINQLNPKTFTFKRQLFPSLNLEAGTHYGLLAADVEAILPSLVHQLAEPEVKDNLGNVIRPQVNFKAVNYTELISVLVAGMKEQQAQIAALQTQIDDCCSCFRSAASHTGSIDLENVNTLQLQQNDPNPFSESTWIRWNIPNDFQNAVIYFYDNNANQVNTYKVNSKGAGELQIFGSGLSSGVYTYSLIVDGRVVDSKKMIKSK